MSLAGIAAIYVLLLTGPPPQESSLGSVCVTAQDQTRAIVVGATVELRGTGAPLRGKTDSHGDSCFTDITPGSYELALEARGFQVEHRKVDVRAHETIHLSVSLVLEEVAQEVT